MSNRLQSSSSLYLRQHADNPVDWWPWSEEAFAEAKAEDKPILVSIGYASCHWCHVMAHECFENEYIARLMNQHFICIKVDREERPDVDQIYMEAVQMINQHGGWPLNVFCLPDGRPFYGGTYFPPEDRGQGVMPWPQLLMRISDYYQGKHKELEENAQNIMANLQHLSGVAAAEGTEWSVRDLLNSARRICDTHDDTNGGFGGAPKFPPTMVLQFLMTLRQSRACGNEFPDLADRVDQVCRTTLDHMARGGLFEQIGGGFCRYCVDAEWCIPHFEKMLYDNALLIETFAIGWSHYRQPIYEAVVRDTVDWLEREMKLPSGLYAASIDADSEQGEGKFYCWTPEEVREQLEPDVADCFIAAYRITSEGNFEEGLSYPQFDGSIEDREALCGARKLLLKQRSQRPAPKRDDKALTFWNGLLARALITAGFVWEEEAWVLRGCDLLDALDQQCRDGEILLAQAINDREGPLPVEGFLDDYATYTHALVMASGREDILGKERSQKYLDRALALTERIIGNFSALDGRSYHFTSSSSETPLLRRTEWYDNATPSGNSTMVHLFSALHFTTSDPKWADALQTLRPSFSTFIEKVPNAVAHALTGCTQDALGLASVTAKTETTLQSVADALSSRCWRPTWFRTDPTLPEEEVMVCVAQTCLPPETSPREAANQIGFPPRR